MAIYDDGFTTYVDRNGKWEPVMPEKAELSINGTPLYRFDKATGVLELSMPPSDLEKMIAGHTDIPAEGIVVNFSLPPFGEQYFEGVKSFKPLADKDGNYYFDSSKGNCGEKVKDADAPDAYTAAKPVEASKLTPFQRFKRAFF